MTGYITFGKAAEYIAGRRPGCATEEEARAALLHAYKSGKFDTVAGSMLDPGVAWANDGRQVESVGGYTIIFDGKVSEPALTPMPAALFVRQYDPESGSLERRKSGADLFMSLWVRQELIEEWAGLTIGNPGATPALVNTAPMRLAPSPNGAPRTPEAEQSGPKRKRGPPTTREPIRKAFQELLDEGKTFSTKKVAYNATLLKIGTTEGNRGYHYDTFVRHTRDLWKNCKRPPPTA